LHIAFDGGRQRYARCLRRLQPHPIFRVIVALSRLLNIAQSTLSIAPQTAQEF